MRTDRIATFCALTLAIVALPTLAEDYAGYLTVDDEDYGYWEERPMVLLESGEVPIDEVTGRHSELTFELEHDLARGLVRQYTTQGQGDGSAASSSSMSVTQSAEAAAATTPTEPPSGDGEWVYLHRFSSFGFGLYQGSDATHHAYCANRPAVWAWLSGSETAGLTPDEVADLVIRDADGMARLKFSCERPIEVTN